MNTFEKEFTNELGNAIHVQVKAQEIEGVPGVLLSISGPNSRTENHVTRAEAEALCEQLRLLLEDGQ